MNRNWIWSWLGGSRPCRRTRHAPHDTERSDGSKPDSGKSHTHGTDADRPSTLDFNQPRESPIHDHGYSIINCATMPPAVSKASTKRGPP